jgi:hypothetical protein
LTKPSKYFFIGLIVNVVILLIFGSYLLVSTALSYNGRCGVFWFFGGQGHPCSRLEYMREESAFALAGALEFWWLILIPSAIAFAVLPAIGYVIGHVRSTLN